mmetsp:Transcript_58889/g.140507  ORF Transcript_58889/g.140507 Transcript_58889/m.140507 type:complete len:1324 (-) Transcript_58889:85-4056(-)
MAGRSKRLSGASPNRGAALAAFDETGVDTRDMDDLLQVSHKKCRAVLRHLTFSSGSPQGNERQANLSSSFQRTGMSLLGSHSAPALPPLQVALGGGAHAEASKQQIFRDMRGLQEDHATLAIADGGSLSWLDLEGIMNDQAADGLLQLSQDTTNSRMSNKSFARSTSRRRSLFEPAVPKPSIAPAVQRSNWPSVGKFERFYYPPIEHLLPAPPPPPVVQKEMKGYQPRESIARMEDMVSPGLNMPHWSAHLSQPSRQMQELLKRGVSQGTSQPGSDKLRSKSFFEAAAVYRKACGQLGVEVLRPIPIFGESVELTGNGEESTQQCYALAEGLRVCEPGQLTLDDMGLTDVGAARLVEVSLTTARLKELAINRSWLGVRTCVVLHTCLRTRSGSSLTKLVLHECGCGSNLEVDLNALPAHEREVFEHCLSEPAHQPEPRRSVRASRILPPRVVRASFAVTSTSVDQDKSVSQTVGLEEPSQHNTSMMTSVMTSGGTSTKAVQPTICSSGSKSDVDSDDYSDSDVGSGAGLGPGGGGQEGFEVVYKEVPLEDLALPARRPAQQVPLLLPLLFQLPHATCNVHYLDLSFNLMSKEAGAALGKFLGHSRLEYLVLNHCGLGDESLNAIAQGFAENGTLMDVRLRCNAFSGDILPAAALLNAAGRHPRMAHLDIAENVLSRACSDELCAAFRWSCSLVAVHFLGLSSGPEAVDIAEICVAWAEANGEPPCPGLYAKEKAPGDDDEEKVFRSLEHPEMIFCRALHTPGLEAWRITQPVPQQLPLRAYPEEHAVAPRSYMPCGCWVCNKCDAVTFRYVVPDHGPGSTAGGLRCKLYVRPSFAGFQRIELRRERGDASHRVVYSSKLLVPRGQHCYLFEASLGHRRYELMNATGQPSTEIQDVPIDASLREGLIAFCRARKYTGAVNVLPLVTGDHFHIPEALEMQDLDGTVECDPWAIDPVRRQRLDECYQVDVAKFQMSDLCHTREEKEVKEAIAELYCTLYESYAIFAGRSLWPLVRHVDVYAFFDEAQILMDSPFAKDAQVSIELTASDVDEFGEEEKRYVSLQDVQQILVQAIGAAHRAREAARGGDGTDADSSAKGSGPERFTQLCSQANPSLRERAANVVEKHREGAPITRSQFIEVLLRAAVATGGRELSAAACFRKFTKRILLGRIMQAPLSPFPRGLLKQAGEVRDAILSHRKMLIEAYERFGSSDAAFQRFAQLLRLCDRTFTAKHVSSIFALVKLPIVNVDVEPPRQGLSYEEFCEAVAWLSTVWQRGRSQGHAKRDPKLRFRVPPKVGDPINQKQFAVHIEAFLQKMRERMLPSRNNL